MVDTMVAGYCLGDTAIAAIGATGSLYNLIVSLAWGLNSGFALVITQSFGAHDARQLKKAIAGTFLLDMGIAAMLTVLAVAFLKPLMRVMNTPEAIMDQAYGYMIVICGGICFTTGTQNAEIVALAVRHMRVVMPFFPVLGILLVLRTAMQAMGQKLAPVLSSGLELAMKIIGAAWMIPAMGFGGIGVNIAVTWSVMAAYLGIVYLVKTRGQMREIALNDGKNSGIIACECP